MQKELVIKVGATVVTYSDRKFVIQTVEGNQFIAIGENGRLTILDRLNIKTANNPTTHPRHTVGIKNGVMAVDLDMLDLDYEPTVNYPSWEPTTQVAAYESLSKFYIDIETTGLDPQVDRVLMVGLRSETGEVTIVTDLDEQLLLRKTINFLTANQPQVLVGHNLFAFDLPFLVRRCVSNYVAQPFKIAEHTSKITSASMMGRAIEFNPVRWYGTDIIDTMQQIAIWDKQAAKLDGYGLKNSVLALKLRDDRRLELDVNQIRDCWETGDLQTIGDYLAYDLEDTNLLAEFLLPVVYYQMNYVPNLSFQQMATVSPACKVQKIHEQLLPGLEFLDADQNVPLESDDKVPFGGATVELLHPGLHRNIAKIDVASLYPSIMLKYGICSRKDQQHKFLGVLDYMKTQRLVLKEKGKQGDKSAKFMDKSLKVLINSAYGFMGVGYYTFNDFQAAALITAYGRKILDLMKVTIEQHGGFPVSTDTDGIYFSSEEPDSIAAAVAQALPSGIEIELEMKHCGMFAPNIKKTYVIVDADGKVDVKGLFRKRNRYPLENKFPIEYIRLYFVEGEVAANAYYNRTLDSIEDRTIDVSEISINRRIGKAEKTLVEAGIGAVGDKVTYYIAEDIRFHKKNGKPLKSLKKYTKTEEYWVNFYTNRLQETYANIHSGQIAEETSPER